VQNLRGGPKNEYGDCIGQTFREVKKQYSNAIFIGVVRPAQIVSAFYMKFKATGLDAKEQLGICCNPDTILQKDDLILFIGRRSTPVRDCSMVNVCEEYIAEAKLRVKGMSEAARRIVKSYKNVLVSE
jgi:hypothetical protein